ncbi:PTS system ascorbate-specific IIB component [Bacillus pakistanensis]|uniref:PTS system ascorbate-specific IIB component n=1 Tax=Rossellomorea pakistanensis TaxID=992288 RepID=A0ABS2ND28_9BACI|nr:PTS sugar transporter subunit IIB [Bacillus pakistanensis]MBM7585748.1 PTS system ascorbate-specific IIB component [Bacillus pakistanensis]
MKIVAVCGSGLGSSFMLEMNIQEVLRELGVTGIEVEHSDLSSATPDMADLFVMAKDIAEGASYLGEKIVLDSIIDQEELKRKLEERMKDLGKL